MKDHAQNPRVALVLLARRAQHLALTPAVVPIRVAMAIGWSIMATGVAAQNLAPASLAAQLFNVTIQSGSPPVTASGDYKLCTSPLGNDFVILGNVEGGLNWGTYSYAATGTNAGVATLVDTQSGLEVSLSLVFSSAVLGQLTLSNTAAAGFQTASFAATNYAEVAVPQLYLPSSSNGIFNAGVSGQAGGIYTLQVSSDLQDWSTLGSLGLTNLAGDFADTNAGSGARFYRAQTALVDFAPNSISGLSLNFSVAEGQAPMATNGFFQWLTDTADAEYEEVAWPALANLPGGTYSYSKIAPGSAVITSVDSDDVTNNLCLVFTSPTSGFFYATDPGESGFQAGGFTTALGPTVFLGNYHFTPDPSRAASLAFAADGNPASLTVMDALSNVWTLILPADALLDSRTITMTPVASVDSTDAVLPAAAAVLLTPDGIEFSDGVTLTVTTPTALGPETSLMNAALDGSGLSIALTTNAGNSYSTTLFHFSSYALSSPNGQQLQNLGTGRDSILAAYNQAASEAQSLVASRVPPPPPPDGMFCDLAAADKAGDAYMAQVFAQDFAVLGQLSSAALALNSLGDSSYASQALTLESQVFQKDIIPKTTLIINWYGGDPAKLPVVCRVAIQIAKQAELLGISQLATFLSLLSDDLTSAGKYYFGQLRNSHQYSGYSDLLAIVQTMQLLKAGDGSSLSSQLANLPGALTFQLSMDITTTTATPPQNGGPGGSSSEEAQGQFQITANSDLSSITGTGPINYVSGIGQGGGLTSALAPGQSFTETSTLQLTDCPSLAAPTATLTFTPFGSMNEMWINSLGKSIVANNLDGQSSYVFLNYQTTNGSAAYGFSFTVPLQDGNAQAVNTTISQSTLLGPSTLTATLVLTLQHTPK